MSQTPHLTIAQQNDLFRTSMPTLVPLLIADGALEIMEKPLLLVARGWSHLRGDLVLTQGIAGLAPPTLSQVLERVRTFRAFTEDNDPHGEHDFGSLDVDGAGTVFWKIDAYAPCMERGSEDAANPDVTVRVLTIMLASEY